MHTIKFGLSWFLWCFFHVNLILKSQVWFQSKYCTVLSSIAIIHCSVLLLCSWFLNTELKCSKFFLQDPCVMPDADWRRTFMAPFFTCMCLSWREQGAFMVLRSIMIKIELTEVMKMNNYFLLTPQMEYELQNNLKNHFYVKCSIFVFQ